MRTSVQSYETGDLVDYNNTKGAWLGPAKVLAQDGKVIFIRHGGQLLRVPPARLRKRSVQDQIKRDNPDTVTTAAPEKASIPAAPKIALKPKLNVKTPDVDVLSDSEDGFAEVQDEMTPPNGETAGVRAKKKKLTKADDSHVDVEPVAIRRSLRSFNREAGASVYNSHL